LAKTACLSRLQALGHTYSAEGRKEKDDQTRNKYEEIKISRVQV
jgi:hypothetical protein